MTSFAEKLLQRFGVERPTQIDLEAIAYELGALVVCSELDGCDGRIVGHGDKAIITINSKSSLERQRFSIGHELGHWAEQWRGKGFLCGRDDIRDSSPLADAKRDAEMQANRFASDLILPNYLFAPACARKQLTIDTAQALSIEFRASITATAIKLVKHGSFMGIVACYSREKREWFVTGGGVPEGVFPSRELHENTEAFEMLYTDRWGKTSVVTTDGSSWINRRDASKYRLSAQSIKIAKDRVLSLLCFLNS